MKIRLNRNGGENGGGVSPLKSLAQGAGVGLATAGVNQLFANYNRNQEMKNQKELMKLSNTLAQDAQKNAAANMAEGYKKAGLSTALLAGGNFSPAIGQSPSSPQKNVQAGLPVTEMIQLGLMNAQKQNIEADTNLKNVEADNQGEDSAGKAIENQRKASADAFFDDFMKKNNPSMYAEWEKQHPGQMMNLGFLNGRNMILDNLLRESDTDTRLSQNELTQMVTNIQKRSPRLYNAIASMPKAQQDSIYGNLARLNMLNQLTKADIGLTNEKTEEVRQAVEKLKVDTVEKLVNNPDAALYLGDDRAAVIGYFDEFLGFAGDAGKEVVGLAGLGKINKAKQLGELKNIRARGSEQRKTNRANRRSSETTVHYDRSGNYSGHQERSFGYPQHE